MCGTFKVWNNLSAAYCWSYLFAVPKPKLVNKLPVIIWMILYHISFYTYAFWINFTTTSTYHIRFYANISAKIAIFKTKSSLIRGSFLASRYPKSSATILLTF